MNLKLLTILLTLALLFSSVSLAAGLQVQVIDEQGKPVAGAVVFLESAAASAAVKPVDDARIVQKDKTFIPDVLVIPRGTAVYFPNEDTVRHHVYSFSAIKPFEIKLYVGTPAAPVLFDQSGVAVLGCNIHDEMIAWVVALDTPYYSRSDQQGLSRLEQVPPGRYTLRVWHKDLLNEQDVPRLAIEIGQQPQQTTVQLPKLAPVF